MPVNSVPETKKGVERSKFSLSLNRNNATYLSNASTKPVESKENPKLCKPVNQDKENKPLKRPFTSTYFNTLNAAKKLKPLTETPKPKAQLKLSSKHFEPEVILSEKQPVSAMLNGHHQTDSQYSGATRKAPIATLSNLGNTCFLNSVLYTLRYAPRFLHNLHHLVSDLSSVEQKLGSIRLKSSSLGRTAAGLASSGARSWSSKDLLSLGQSDNSSAKSKIQIATEKLHETYLSLRAVESKCLNGAADASPEPYAADAFLAALRDVNSTFEGNRQQDAHELLVCILDNIRETCRALAARALRLHLHENGDSTPISRQPESGDPAPAGGKALGNLRKSWSRRKDGKTERPKERTEPTTAATAVGDDSTRPGWDFVAEDFEGTMVVRTTCVECETVTERAQAVCELCVPVPEEDAATPGTPPHAHASHATHAAHGSQDEPFRAACLTTEYLRDQNKYWCERCLRHNEARRSVAYPRLPRLLVLQLRRFSGGMQKITRHAPTPRHMPCFCERCDARAAGEAPQHRYVLWAVIMHLGQTLSGGHYVSYARAAAAPAPAPAPAERCGRATLSHDAPPATGFMRSLFSRPRAVTTCAANECCVPRPRPTSSWLACDDDLVRPISNEEFEDLLSAEPKMRTAGTPYLLFYVKSEVG